MPLTMDQILQRLYKPEKKICKRVSLALFAFTYFLREM